MVAFALITSIADLFEFPGAFTEEPETREELRLLSGDPALVIADVGASILFLLAGAAFGRRAERLGRRGRHLHRCALHDDGAGV